MLFCIIFKKEGFNLDLPKIEDCNKENIKLLKRYEMIMKNKGLTEESQKAIKGDLSLFIRFLKDSAFKDITSNIVEDFLFYCQDERKNQNCTIGRKYTTLNSFFNTLIKKEYLPDNFKNPLFKIDKIKSRKKVKDFLTEDEVNKIFDFLEEKQDLRGIALTYLLYSSAIRINELFQLNKDSIDFEKRKFKVLGKGQKERVCYISEIACEKVKQYLDSRTDDIPALFISRQYNRWSKRTIQRYIKRLVNEVGIYKHITPHSYRHSILTNLRLNGTSLENLQLLAGHSSISTTQATYTHVGLDDISNNFDNFFNTKFPIKENLNEQ